ncbi:protein jag [Sanguibacter gelidistatuariae]|uniref:Jag family protein n=1 Tax=Sanguibacter gelidistatuariae TaxID=1814289 RepID=UPI000B813E97|nr:R3H domain-containing nucleic acid-binding protein [Sanguibacter gelidistatuariae]
MERLVTADSPAVEPEVRTKTSLLEEEGEVAADYLEELLDIADLDGDIDIDVDHGRAAVEVVADEAGSLRHLVGAHGEVLDALQELTRLAVQTRTGERSRLMLDIAGYRAGRRVELTALAEETIEKVRTTGEKLALAPMNAFERKVVHDAVTASGLVSESHGVEPSRYIEVSPAAEVDSSSED